MAPTLVTPCPALPPEGASLALGRPGGDREMAPTLVTPCPALPPEGTSLALGRPGGDRGLDEPIDERALSKLRWRCRRGLLENDLLIARFFEQHAATLTVGQAAALSELMELPDNDLLDLLLRRRQPDGELDRYDVTEVLEQLRPQLPQGRRL